MYFRDVKVVGVIINNGRVMIGLVLRGKKDDLGDKGKAVIEKPISIDKLKEIEFSNCQIEIDKRGNIEEFEGFRIHNLRAYRIRDNGELELFDNRIVLVVAYMIKEKVVGYAVKFSDGSVVDMKNEQIVKISKWYKPVNFMLQYWRSSGNTKIVNSRKYGNLSEIKKIRLDRRK